MFRRMLKPARTPRHTNAKTLQKETSLQLLPEASSRKSSYNFFQKQAGSRRASMKGTTGAGKHEGRAAVRHSKRPEPELNQEDAAGG